MLTTTAQDDATTQYWIAVFQHRLHELGWSDGQNLKIDARSAGGDIERMRTAIAEIVALAPDVILAQNTPMVAALHKQTKTLPIVFVQVSDPVGDGFVESLAIQAVT